MRLALTLVGLVVAALYVAGLFWAGRPCVRPFPCGCPACQERQPKLRTFDEGVDALISELDKQAPPPSTDRQELHRMTHLDSLRPTKSDPFKTDEEG